MTLELTQIRRLLLGLSFLIALLSGGAIYYVGTATAEVDSRTVRVTAYTDSEKSVAKMKKDLGSRGYTINTASTKHNFKIPNGFYLVMADMDRSMVKALGQALIQKQNIKRLGLETANGGTALRIRKRFPDKKSAEKCAARIKSEDSYNFKVVEATKDKTKMGFSCTIASIPSAESDGVVNYLESHKFIDVDSTYEDAPADESGAENTVEA
ncbi:MAG: hypothetical protein ACI38Q_00125 [Candidatus Bruticola sp.]